MATRSFRWLFWGLALVGLLLDQTSKYTIFAWLHAVPYAESRVIPDIFELQTRHASDGVPDVNKGALFGLGQGSGDWANNAFAVISVLAAAGIVYWSTRKSTARDWALCASLGLILAGTLGNLYDRLVFSGVRDFLHWHYQQRFDWPVFNVADCCLVVGAILLLGQAFLGKAPAPENAPVPAAKA
jgi:signal peptidase II